MGVHVLTGASSGIGEAVAEMLHGRGESLYLIGRDPAPLLRFAGAAIVRADLFKTDDVAKIQLPDHIDSFVHVAGTVDLGSVADLTAASWERQWRVNLLAAAVLLKAALPGLRRASGTVVLVNSRAGLAARAGNAAYAASKAGLRSLADALRDEERSSGIRVTSLFPSRTATSMQERVRNQEGLEYHPEECLTVSTVAGIIVDVLELSSDAVLPEIILEPRNML